MILDSPDRDQNRRVPGHLGLSEVQLEQVWDTVTMSGRDNQQHQEREDRHHQQPTQQPDQQQLPGLYKNESINENTVFVNPASLNRVHPPHSVPLARVSVPGTSRSSGVSFSLAGTSALGVSVAGPSDLASSSSSSPGVVYVTTADTSANLQQQSSSLQQQSSSFQQNQHQAAASIHQNMRRSSASENIPEEFWTRGVKRLSSGEQVVEQNVFGMEDTTGNIEICGEENSNGSYGTYSGVVDEGGCETTEDLEPENLIAHHISSLPQEQLAQVNFQHHWQQSINMESKFSKSGYQPCPSGKDVSLTDYPGDHQFEVKFSRQTAKSKHWDFSSKLKKLFIDMNKWVQVEFKIGPQPPPQLYIRTLPVYADPSSRWEPVKRCPNHAAPNEPSNKDFLYPEHIIRYQSETDYAENSESGRLFSKFEVYKPHQGTDSISRMIKFMCLGSDVGGINRRPVKVVFTLEDIEENVIGRSVIDVRICSCPRRDRQQEENKHDQKELEVRKIAEKCSSKIQVPEGTLHKHSVVYQPPPGKKKKMDKDTIFMVPVHHEDFKKINEFAESTWIMRDRENEEAIKETRRKLIKEFNSENIRKAQNLNQVKEEKKH